MCAPGKTPQIRNGRLECDPDLECPSGQVAMQTEAGKVCQASTSSPAVTTGFPITSEPPCPYGLVPLQTSVGRVCQYLPPKDKHNDVTDCPDGELLKTDDGTIECIYDHQRDHIKCPADKILIKTETGYICAYGISKKKNCLTGIFDKYGECVTECPEGLDTLERIGGKQCVPKMNTCPFGTIMVDGTCHDINMNNLCPVGQEFIETADGFDCVYRQQKHPGDGTKPITCSSGQILSQAMRTFYCETHNIPTSEVMECHLGEIFVKVGGGYACITELEASLQCTESQVLIRLADGFSCVSMKGTSSKKHQIPLCGFNEVQLTDENGYQVCISLDRATMQCGVGYKAVKIGQEFICRKQKLDLHCPKGFVLSFDGDTPACVSEIDLDCFPLGRQVTPECLQKLSKRPLSPCENGYQLEESAGIFECSLIDQCKGSQDCEKPSCVNQDGVDVRSCDIDPAILLAGCNPECANGGTCNNGRCLCPIGITGTACNEDVNECQSLQSNICEYQCQNTFGSYQCSCPAGMTLQTDSRTCRASHCSPDCLNGGSCINGRCRCPRGFQGEFCQTDVNECDMYGDRLCQHTCRNTYGRYSCICPHGTRLNADGRTCTNTTCIPQCRNGGECVDNRCVCATGFYGRVCQLDINECYKNQPCSHSCVNLRGSYRCSCPKGLMLQPDGHTCR